MFENSPGGFSDFSPPIPVGPQPTAVALIDLDEGFATFWETTDVGPDRTLVGIPHRPHLKTLFEEPPLPLPALFAVDRE